MLTQRQENIWNTMAQFLPSLAEIAPYWLWDPSETLIFICKMGKTEIFPLFTISCKQELVGSLLSTEGRREVSWARVNAHGYVLWLVLTFKDKSLGKIKSQRSMGMEEEKERMRIKEGNTRNMSSKHTVLCGVVTIVWNCHHECGLCLTNGR